MSGRVPGMLLFIALGLPAGAPAAELAGVTLPEQEQVGNARLVLNGIGLRKKVFFKVYVAGLYLPARSTNPLEIVERDVPRALHMQFVRDVGRDQLVQAYRDGFGVNHPPERIVQLQNEIDRFLTLLIDVREGDRIVYRYEPGVGAAIDVAGRNHARFPGRDFADAYLRVFLGPKPPTEDLKNGLLGR